MRIRGNFTDSGGLILKCATNFRYLKPNSGAWLNITFQSHNSKFKADLTG